MPLPVMLPSFWVVSTKPGAALGRVKGSLQPLQGRGWFLAPRDRGPGAGVECWKGHLVGHVRQERHLARPLDRHRNLALVAPARPGDAARADLPLLGDVPPQLVVVLVVDLVDLLAAEVAVLPARAAGRPARWLPSLAVALSRWGHRSPSRTGCRR